MDIKFISFPPTYLHISCFSCSYCLYYSAHQVLGIFYQIHISLLSNNNNTIVNSIFCLTDISGVDSLTVAKIFNCVLRVGITSAQYSKSDFVLKINNHSHNIQTYTCLPFICTLLTYKSSIMIDFPCIFTNISGNINYLRY